MFKNVASQKITVYAVDASTGLPKSGDAANITVYLSKDDGSVTALTDTSATEADATNAKGDYLFDVSQTESNADKLRFTGKSTTANVVIVPQTIYTRPNRFSTLVIDAAGLADANAVKVGPTGAGTAQTARDLGLALPAAAPNANGGLPILSSSGTTLAYTISTLTTYTGDTPQTGDSFARLTGTGAVTFASLTVSGATTLTGAVSATNASNDVRVDARKIGGTTQTGLDLGGNWTATRAGYLDNLNIGGNVAASSEVTAIQNNTRVVRVVPEDIELPASSTRTYRIELLLYDSTGNMEAPDSAPTIALVNQAGTDRSGRLDSTTMALVSTGRYRAVYTSTAGDTKEQLVWSFSVVEGGATRLYGNTSWITDAIATDFTSSDRSLLTTLATDYTTARAAKLDNLDATVGSRMATYAQPTGFLAATFPGTVASPTNITAASGVSLAAVQSITSLTITGAFLVQGGAAFTNAAGHAFEIGSTGGNGHGIHAYGAGSGDGIRGFGGSSGSGLHVIGQGAGPGIFAIGGAASYGAAFVATTGSGLPGLFVQGKEAAPGALFLGGTTGPGATFTGQGGAADILASLSGSVGSVTAKTGYSLTSAYDAAKTAAQAGDAMALTPTERASVADKALGRNIAGGSDGGRTVTSALRSIRNKVAFDVLVIGQFTVYAEDDSTPAWTGTYTSAVGANPVTGIDPA